LRRGIPHLIPEHIQRRLELERFKTRSIISAPQKRKDVKKGETTLSEEELLLVEQIKAMDKMALGYRKYVADYLELAPSSAISYERYEDLIVRDTVKKYIDLSKKNKVGVVFIEIGCGPGRYLIQYGGKIESNKLACKKYRDHPDIGSFYAYDEEYADNLVLIIGVDFSEEMLNSALRWIYENRLDRLLFEGKIILIRGIAQYLNLSFKSTPYENSYKVVICVFQTLGNQLERSLQIKMLQRMRDLVKPHGTMLVSVFNKSTFLEYFPKYYKKIEPTIGPIISSEENHKKGILKTKWGIYSCWFGEEELRKLFLEASKTPSYNELANVQIKSGDALPIFPDDADYLSVEEQKSVRKRAIIATLDII
jgi:ubiquinone/menaquinone biosynthesis C-methylase UbiE